MAAETVFEWGAKETRLRDVDSAVLPKAVKVTHGQYLKVGVTKSKTPENLYQELLLHSIQTNKKVVAHALKASQVGKVATSDVELKLSIPLTYQGWFEVMSEDGRASRPLLNVHELSKFVNETCLVREDTKGYQTDEKNQLRFDLERIIRVGDRLKIIDSKAISVPGRVKKLRVLHCINSRQEHVYIPHDTKCSFSIITTTNNTSGVHTIDNIATNFRLPITVRIVYGSSPSALKNMKFSGILRLVSLQSDDTAFFMPIAPRNIKEKMIPINTEVPLKFCFAGNHDKYMENTEIQELLRRCGHMVLSYRTSIHVLVNMPDPGLYKPIRNDSFSDSLPLTDNTKTRVVDVLFDEVDDLYGYVRDGGPPPESRLGQLTGIESNDWEEPIYECIEKYQKPKIQDGPVESNVKPEVDSVQTTVVTNTKFSPVAVQRINSIEANENIAFVNQVNNFQPHQRVPQEMPASPQQMYYNGQNHYVQASPGVPVRDMNGREIQTKVYHNDTVLITYAKTKSSHSGGSSGEKHSRDSKDNRSTGSRDSPSAVEHKVVTKKKSMRKNLYL